MLFIPKHLGVYLDKKLSFHQHIEEIITKASKGIGVIKKLNNFPPRKALLTIYKSFVRPHLDYGDILYHQPYNESVNSKLESIQYNAILAITGAIKGTFRLKLYKELGLESLKSQRTLRPLRHLWAFHKIVSNHLPSYLFNLSPQSTHAYQTRTSSNIPGYQCRTDTFKHSFFSLTFAEWNKIHPDIRNASITVFKKHLLKKILPDPHPVYNICKPIGLKLLTRLRLGLSHLNEQNLIITLRTVLTLCALVVWRLKQPLIFSCIAITIILSDLHCLTSFVKLMSTFQIFLKRSF